MHVSALYYYPIKSCGAVQVEAAEIDACGLRHDRRLLVIEPDGMFITQREHPRLALVNPAIQGDDLSLSAPGMEPLAVTLGHSGTPYTVRIFRDTCEAVDQGDAVAEWFSTYLNTPCRVVAMAPHFARQVNQNFAQRPEDQVAFADAFPFLMISEASLDDLNARMDSPLPMNRFRPNIVVTGCEPYAEDTWPSLRIGSVDFAAAKACVRCMVTTTDQATTERGEEPLKTLATYRQTDTGVIFGQNLIHLNHGIIRVGDTVTAIER
ncbi:MAG: hypothetical protein ETSY2_02800 [Candidatus Entotheonella gemina]|uniref:MOSC domain-containing protein n=1 Tax=Candidatus Entotheonella gemina TaxID=1429439 RepID=W4MEW9_9BACT|nr:MAG: hypothetical protein ETSY2_02800 [Candidatus Entotheonella gemina]